MKIRLFILVCLFSFSAVFNVVYSQENQENKTKVTTVFHDIQGVSGKASFTQIAPKTRIPTIVKTTGMRDTVSEFLVHDTIIVKGSEVRFAFKFDERISYFELVGVGRASKADIKAGKWEVTVKPQKTTIYRYNRREEGLLVTQRAPGVGCLVIVVDSEAELQEAWDKYRKALKQQSPAWKTKFL